MRWGIIQWDVQRRMEENLHQVEHGLQTTALDVAVLPEMCLCGYLFQDAAHIAQAAREAPLFLEALEALSRQYDCAIIAGLPRQEGKRVYNSPPWWMPAAVWAFMTSCIFPIWRKSFSRRERRTEFLPSVG